MYVPPPPILHESDTVPPCSPQRETDGALLLQLHPPLRQRHHDRWQAQDEPEPGRLNDSQQSKQKCGKFRRTSGKGVEGVSQWVDVLFGGGCVKHPGGAGDDGWWQLNPRTSQFSVLPAHTWIWIWRSIQLLGFLVLQGVQFVQCDCGRQSTCFNYHCYLPQLSYFSYKSSEHALRYTCKPRNEDLIMYHSVTFNDIPSSNKRCATSYQPPHGRYFETNTF